MAAPHPTGPYPRFHDFPADQSNFPPNPTFPLALDPQDVCSGGSLMGATSTAHRHQGNFLLGTDNLMPINTPQYPSSSASSIGTNSGGSGAATQLGVGSVTGVPGGRSGSSVVLPPGAPPGPVPFSPIRMVDRQQVNMAPPVAAHFSSSLSNFNLTSIIPEIDGKSNLLLRNGFHERLEGW
ncbi:hypothetical protein E2C01_084510 [Portunus trituberculatus]|uniref:Uncharacterized protein n=1 Tax=Portunus trituberculatus TaxID=210409 RepID=A0A5B7J6H0_PORTR|nr:hypothetical protein [Portunus trituberculatus]